MKLLHAEFLRLSQSDQEDYLERYGPVFESIKEQFSPAAPKVEIFTTSKNNVPAGAIARVMSVIFLISLLSFGWIYLQDQSQAAADKLKEDYNAGWTEARTQWSMKVPTDAQIFIDDMEKFESQQTDEEVVRHPNFAVYNKIKALDESRQADAAQHALFIEAAETSVLALHEGDSAEFKQGIKDWFEAAKFATQKKAADDHAHWASLESTLTTVLSYDL